MSSSTSSTQRVPAWKRLGLKLKSAPGDENHTSATTPATTAPSSSGPTALPVRTESLNGAKRKPSGPLAPDHSSKKARRDTLESHQTPNKKAKSVSFAAEATSSPAPAVSTTTTTNGNQAASATPKKQPAAKKKANSAATAPTAKQPKKQGPVNLEPALAYLRQWRTARSDWKFNKNHQTRLLEQVFAVDETTIPPVDIAAFYEYIRGLQGGVRARLAALARGVREQDMEAQFSVDSSKAKGKGKKEEEEKQARKQKEYEDVIAAYLQQERTPGKRRFEEVDYVLRTADPEMQRRVVKRMRAEMVLDELAESASEVEITATSTTSSSAAVATTTATQNGDGDGEMDVDGDDTRMSLNDGSQQRVKRRRLRKSRTAAVDEDSSSSDSDSDSSSSDSSDDEDDDGGKKIGGVKAKPKAAAAADTSDTSSSSSSSEASSSDSESSSDSDSSEDDD